MQKKSNKQNKKNYYYRKFKIYTSLDLIASLRVVENREYKIIKTALKLSHIAVISCADVLVSFNEIASVGTVAAV